MNRIENRQSRRDNGPLQFRRSSDRTILTRPLRVGKWCQFIFSAAAVGKWCQFIFSAAAGGKDELTPFSPAIFPRGEIGLRSVEGPPRVIAAGVAEGRDPFYPSPLGSVRCARLTTARRACDVKPLLVLAPPRPMVVPARLPSPCPKVPEARRR